jgi:hypothetical protein
MANSSASAAVCSVCGKPLGAKGKCFACLLRAGLDEADQSVAAEAAAVFDDFEIARREDGSLWELGRGAMGVTYRATEKTLHRSVALKVIGYVVRRQSVNAFYAKYARQRPCGIPTWQACFTSVH